MSLVLVDIFFGYIFQNFIDKVGLRGDYETCEMTIRNFDKELVVLGSSVALNSINTGTISDSMRVSAINGASNGQTLPFYLTMLKSIISQKKPQKVILGMLPSNLVDSGLGNRYNFLAPYYGMHISDVDSCMNSKSLYEPWLLKSNFYRLNTIWFRILLYNFITPGVKGKNGFLAKPFPSVFPERLQIAKNQNKISHERRQQIKEFINLCKSNNIDLIVLLTPRCVKPTPDYTDSVAIELCKICNINGVRFFDDMVLSPFSKDSSLFYDTNHVNITGSKIYTDTIINRLK